jgi:hypothetical protein
MFQGEELVRVAYGEFLRFALAMEMQRERLAHWRDDLRSQREVGREASLEAIFSLPSGADVEQHLRRIRTRYEAPSLMHVKNEAHFLLVAIKNIDRMAYVLRSALRDDGQTVRCMQGALNAFESASPEVKHLRNLNEHVDEFLRSKGDAYSKLPEPELGSALAVLEDDVAYFIGGKAWSTSKLADAAGELVSAVRACIANRDARDSKTD